jgi:hypothetical protein
MSTQPAAKAVVVQVVVVVGVKVGAGAGAGEPYASQTITRQLKQKRTASITMLLLRIGESLGPRVL